ncbi:MAG: CDP-alcohol phosphatidyltransferase family protein [Rhodospirillales bacterium]|nr:CDP-alcohol phosphatidyltransferase family protein [Rhodospirillales bacterium]
MVNTRITPNQITTLRLATGIGAAASFAVGEELWSMIGCGVFVVSMLLDRADGILARLSDKTSPGGHKFDLVADSLSNSLAFIGIGIGLHQSSLGELAIPLGIVAGIAITAVLWLVMRAEEQEGSRVAELEGTVGFDPDDAMLALPVAVLLGWGTELIVAAAFGASIFAVYFFFKFRRFLK